MPVARNSRARACRSAQPHIAMICSAPSSVAARTPSRPTAPSTTTATVFPAPAAAPTAANHPVPPVEAGRGRGRRTHAGRGFETVTDTGHPDREAQSRGSDGRRLRRHVETLADDDDGRGDQRGNGVELTVQHDRHPTDQHVAQRATTDPGDRAENDRLHRVETEVECLTRAGDGEPSRACSVEHRDGYGQALQPALSCSRSHTGVIDLERYARGRLGIPAIVRRGRPTDPRPRCPREPEPLRSVRAGRRTRASAPGTWWRACRTCM